MRNFLSESFKDVKFLWRKFIFFGVIVIAAGVGIGYADIHPATYIASLFDRMQVAADEVIGTTSTQSSDYNINIFVAENGALKINGKQVEEKVEPQADYDELRYVVFDGDKKMVPNYYSKVVVDVHLPKNITAEQLPSINRRLITAHGVGSTEPSEFVDGKTIRFIANDVPSTGIVTAEIDFPKGYLNLGVAGEVARATVSISGLWWILISILLPAVSLVILFATYWRVTGFSLENPPQYILKEPPDNLSPAEVGVLTHGRIRSKELLAAIISLADRGLVGIEDRDGQILVYRRAVRDQALWQNLRPFESAIMKELFGAKKLLNTAEEIKSRDSKELFSRRVTNIYENLYSSIIALGFFKDNPVALHWRYRIVGLILLAAGAGGFFYAMFKLPDPKFPLFLWAAMMAIALVVIIFASRISTRTAKGKAELERWLAFRNYLAQARAVTLREVEESEFEKYLPYAIALDVELEWAARFSKTDFKLPEWYGAAQRVLDVEDFAQNFFPLLGTFTQQLSYMKEPVIE